MRKMLSVARKGDFGRGMYKIKDHTFGLESAPSVKVKFTFESGKVSILELIEPGLRLTASIIS